MQPLNIMVFLILFPLLLAVASLVVRQGRRNQKFHKYSLGLRLQHGTGSTGTG